MRFFMLSFFRLVASVVFFGARAAIVVLALAGCSDSDRDTSLFDISYRCAPDAMDFTVPNTLYAVGWTTIKNASSAAVEYAVTASAVVEFPNGIVTRNALFAWVGKVGSAAVGDRSRADFQDELLGFEKKRLDISIKKNVTVAAGATDFVMLGVLMNAIPMNACYRDVQVSARAA
ncbi:hypothetical protein FSC37_22370 [Piscinibacter aquaticus]|uniref:Uncharacterized protein n=1 Tax=Piscinibacter aquaticus TaxID=392597 RepID=A0A5C6TPI4_9BURK|nr:hypothetical protein FSC37_22370 [Piscinibacter aquaticus]